MLLSEVNYFTVSIDFVLLIYYYMQLSRNIASTYSVSLDTQLQKDKGDAEV